jgi:adenylate cyclase
MHQPRLPRSVPPSLRKIAAGLALGLTAAALVLAMSWTGMLDEAELAAYDWRIRASADPSSVHPDIVIVEVNDTSIRDLAPFVGRWPWPRVVFAWLLDYLNRAPARVVLFDFGFLEPDRSLGVVIGEKPWSGAESDAALADALRRSRATVLLADAVYAGVREQDHGNPPPDWRPYSKPFQLGPAIAERPMVVPPLEPFMKGATLLGHNWLPFDLDGPARRMAPFIRQGDRYMPSLGIAAAILGGGFDPREVVLDGGAIVVRDRRIPLVPLRIYDALDRSRYETHLTTLINYRAPPLVNGRRPYPSYEVRHLLASAEQIAQGAAPDVDPVVFKDKIVLIGLTTSGLMDAFATPFGSDKGTMPGIQLHATMADNLLSNRFIRPAPGAARVWTVIGAGVLIGLLSAFLAFIPAAAGTVVAAGGWTWFAFSSFEGGLWLNMVQPLLTMAVALFAGTTYQYFVEGREKRRVKSLFGRFVSRDVFKQLIDHPGLAQLGGRRRDMSVLFCDIRGFTTITERGDAEALVSQLNEYFTRMVDIVFRHQGTVDKFVGDMVMALFGAPLDDPDHPDHAVATAVDMVEELGQLNQKWAAEGLPQFDMGIGINSGDMIAGHIGSTSIMSYTVIGDNVNLGARLETLNKEHGSRIIISGATRSRLRAPYQVRALGAVIVKGKTRPVEVFEVVVPSPLSTASEEVPS